MKGGGRGEKGVISVLWSWLMAPHGGVMAHPATALLTWGGREEAALKICGHHPLRSERCADPSNIHIARKKEERKKKNKRKKRRKGRKGDNSATILLLLTKVGK